jgi:hypothetical protein
MDEANPILSKSFDTQINNPQISQARRNHQRTQAFRIRQMTFMEVKSAAFLVRKEGFDLKPFMVAIASFVRQLEIRHQEDGCKISPFPPGVDGHWSISLAGEPYVRDADLIPWAQAQIAERKRPIVFVELSILGSPTYVTAVIR